MKRLIPMVFLALPIALFAQSPQSPRVHETAMLKGFGLNDSQIGQVLDIQDKTQTTIKQDAVELRLLHAEMEKALLPVSPNMQEVNGYIAQMAQTRGDLMKTFVGARVQLRQILGDDNFRVYARFIMHRYGIERRRGALGQRHPVPGPEGMLSQQPPATEDLNSDNQQD